MPPLPVADVADDRQRLPAGLLDLLGGGVDVPSSLGCGSAVLAISAMLAPSAAARLAIASPIPRLAPEMNMVFPESDMAHPMRARMSAVTALVSRIRSAGPRRRPSRVYPHCTAPGPSAAPTRRRRSAMLCAGPVARCRRSRSRVDRSAAARSAIVGLRDAQRRGGGLQRQLRRHRQHRDGQPFGQRHHQRLEHLFGGHALRRRVPRRPPRRTTRLRGSWWYCSTSCGTLAATSAAIAGVAARATGRSSHRLSVVPGTSRPVPLLLTCSRGPSQPAAV